MMSASMLTGSPTVLAPRVVSRKVSGIRLSPTTLPSISLTVSETPSMVIEPFSTTYLVSSAGMLTRTHSQLSLGSRLTMWPRPSTCPCTTWPPKRVAAFMARSRLTTSPTFAAPRLVRRRVSCITSAVKCPGSISTAVRHVPLTAIESPRFTSLVTNAPSMVMRLASGWSSMLTTRPSSSMIPVNISYPSRWRE